eukprot:4304048-Heterocapsa_arctica.AAC.1
MKPRLNRDRVRLSPSLFRMKQAFQMLFRIYGYTGGSAPRGGLRDRLGNAGCSHALGRRSDNTDAPIRARASFAHRRRSARHSTAFTVARSSEFESK